MNNIDQQNADIGESGQPGHPSIMTMEVCRSFRDREKMGDLQGIAENFPLCREKQLSIEEGCIHCFSPAKVILKYDVGGQFFADFGHPPYSDLLKMAQGPVGGQ